MTRCAGCRHPVDDATCLVATMHGEILGDEYVEAYYRCAHCGTVTLAVVRDRFLGEEVVVTEGTALEAGEAERRLALIGRCDESWNKRCRCDAHREYFGDALD